MTAKSFFSISPLGNLSLMLHTIRNVPSGDFTGLTTHPKEWTH